MKRQESAPACLFSGPKPARRTAVLGHSAGQGTDSRFMNAFATGLAEAGLGVLRFQLPDMRARRETGVRRPPAQEES